MKSSSLRLYLAMPGHLRQVIRALRMLLLYRRPIAAFRNRLSSNGLGEANYELRNGLHITLDASREDVVTVNEVWIDKLYELDPRLMARKNWTVFDVGAHKGVFAARVAFLMRTGFLYCYEPDPHNFSALHSNLDQRLYRGIDLHISCAAMSDKTGRVTLFRDLGSSVSHSIVEGSAGVPLEVVSISLDDALSKCAHDTVDLLKLDVEGAELSILRAAGQRTMSRIKRIVLEFHPSDEIPDLELQLRSLLTDAGFEVGCLPTRRMMWGVKVSQEAV